LQFSKSIGIGIVFGRKLLSLFDLFWLLCCTLALCTLDLGLCLCSCSLGMRILMYMRQCDKSNARTSAFLSALSAELESRGRFLLALDAAEADWCSSMSEGPEPLVEVELRGSGDFADCSCTFSRVANLRS